MLCYILCDNTDSMAETMTLTYDLVPGIWGVPVSMAMMMWMGMRQSCLICRLDTSSRQPRPAPGKKQGLLTRTPGSMLGANSMGRRV